MDNALLPSANISFLHPVGQSTLRQGMTLPRSAEVGWLKEIQKGEKVPVSIQFSQAVEVPASLRRLNNARGHLQFRYETKQQALLRTYLAEVFQAAENALLRVTEIQPRVFLFEPVSAVARKGVSLSLNRPHFHHCSKEQTVQTGEFGELEQSLRSVVYDENADQAAYNKQIAATLHAKGWKTETRIVEAIGLRCDFEKNGVWVEVEFGNARSYYQDYIKRRFPRSPSHPAMLG